MDAAAGATGTTSDVLGATVSEAGTRFVVTSAVAERIELCLFDADGAETDRLDLDAVDDTWSVDVGGVVAEQRYGYRVHGPGNPSAGHACDPAKLLVDPAARRLVGEVRWSNELVTPGVDSAGLVPRSVVVAPPADRERSLAPRRSWDETVVYEAHVGHLTALHPLVAAEHRGRFTGLGAPVIVDHLTRLGVTAVELLPVAHFVSEPALVAAGRRNVWGYNPLAWGAPHAGYASPGASPVAELRSAVAALHQAGIEVWLDVVVNHTCEGSLGTGPILSWRGFDNAATYRLRDGADGLVDDDVTGCGNAIDTRSPAVRRLIRELLVRWVVEFGIDGFRFDLAATLLREDSGPTAHGAFLEELRSDERLAGTRLIAEPWDTGLGGYVLGAFPAPWREWNDRFRDDVRSLWRGEPSPWPAVAARLTGSADLFRVGGDPPARDATTGINAVATHDGFTVADLVTYATPVGGGHGQGSSNSGLEGPTTDGAVMARRHRRQRALLATMLCAQGVPMINSGDEIGRSQGGVADGYTLESDTGGLRWSDADWDLAAWLAVAVRLRHRHRALRRSTWVAPGDPEVRWLTAAGEVFVDGDWTDPAQVGMAVVLAGVEEGDAQVLVLFAPVEPVTFVLPGGTWWVALDAADSRGDDVDRRGVTTSMTVDAPGLVVLVDRR